ncbi:MAG: hypothetical protein OXQ94_07415 [Gemmatimonadota bacterium]|nr:hypothetical protein [Gemmatimonadota bacterium]MDE2871504.1 hypothetical protein [Gemmatimonadota bacterium]
MRGRRAGERIVRERARRQVRTFLDELRNGTTNYRTVASLGDQVAQEYRERAVLELLQNAHDVLGGSDDPGQVSFVLTSSPGLPELLIANSGRPFRREDFSGICELAQSPKDPNESVGNKGLGFQSVLELSTCPEVWSTAPSHGEPAFTFGFHPEVREPIGRVAQSLFKDGLSTDPEFGEEPVVDWSERQIEEYRRRVSGNGGSAAKIGKWLAEEVRYLSPYVIPRTLGSAPSWVARLLDDGHVTVIRLPLDGGRMGSRKKAVNSVRSQLEALDEAAMVFLQHLSVLRTEVVDGEVVELTRRVEPTQGLPGHGRDEDQAVRGALHTRLRVARTTANESGAPGRLFHVWSRIAGGKDQPGEAERIKKAVEHLPNRWPEMRRVDVSVAVEDAREAPGGAFVIFLPTTIKTGLRAHVNAPFYGTLDRKHIDFGDEYNDLILEFLTDLMLDAVVELVEGPAERWQGRAVVDLLGQAGPPPADDPELARRLRERARGRERVLPLEQLALILCDGGWQRSDVARTMPKIPCDDPFGEAEWRRHAGFVVASSALDERREAVEDLLRALEGSPDPTEAEWAETLAEMARWVGDGQPEPAWDDFLRSALAVLPWELTSEPAKPEADPLRAARFLPTSDGRLCAVDDDVRVFFRPRQGDDTAGFADSIPDWLRAGIAFLHSGVKTLSLVVDGNKMLNTPVQKFLDGRFVRSFRREDILRAVVDLSPKLRVAHGTTEAIACAEILSWTLKLVGEEEQEGLVPLLGQLPVACIGGWFAMKDAVFGPGWDGRSGDHLAHLAACLPEGEGEGLLGTALLPPGDSKWNGAEAASAKDDPETETAEVTVRCNMLARAGVVEGLRLIKLEPTIVFWMKKANPELPEEAPERIPQGSWDHWRDSVRAQIDLVFVDWHEYELDEIRQLPVRDLLHREDLADSARRAVAKLILSSMANWEVGWDKVTLRKKSGRTWSQQITSPLKHWLSTLPWLDDRTGKEHTPQREPQPLHQRWLVPESLLRLNKGHFRHLSPLSQGLARRLAEDEELLEALAGRRRGPTADRGEGLGLNIYPTEEDERTGPALLDALARVVQLLTRDGPKNGGMGPVDEAEADVAMPAGGFDVLLGQIRHAWSHFDPSPEPPKRLKLPERFVVRTRPYRFQIRTAADLGDVYLPDHTARTRSLREHHHPILAMWPKEARGAIGDLLHENGARRASELEEQCLVDGHHAAGLAGRAQGLERRFEWLPVVLLSLAAHGGNNPRGPTTERWMKARERLQRARVLLCDSINVELLDSKGESVARSEPDAYWWRQDDKSASAGPGVSGILLLNRDFAASGLYERFAPAAQAMLGRQDLLKDLRLVLGALAGSPQPTHSQVGKALGRAEIDGFDVANIRGQCGIGPLRDRIRPVLALLSVSDGGFDEVSDLAGLTAWLAHKFEVPQWSAEELLAAARECYDDADMGYRAWQALGDAAELPKWNEALKALGGDYEPCRNEHAEAQAKRCLSESAPLLRAFARHVATRDTEVAIKVQGALFERVVHVHEGAVNDPQPRHVDGWTEKFWQVPFEAVLGVLRAGYDGIPEAKGHLDLFEGVRNTHELRSALERLDADLDQDPREVARNNRDRLDRVVRRVRECHAAWLMRTRGESTSSAKDADLFHASMYLRDWSDDELFESAKQVVADDDFRDRVGECATIEEMLDTLGLTRKDLEEARRRHEKRDAVDEREKRTVEVAGEPFEIGGPVSYRELFVRLRNLPDLPEQVEGIGPPPPGPDSGGATRPGVSGGSELSRRRPKTGHLHGPPDLPELVGIVGEMHAFRFLHDKDKFGIDESAWVSESRTKVVPLLDGEEDLASDSLGYDFRFTHDQVTWCVEVKATTGDGTGFDLPPSEVDAATRIAPRRNERWRILRVTKALTRKPECYWLPNPFEPGPGERLRLRREGGATVEYSLPKSAKGDSQQKTRTGENA